MSGLWNKVRNAVLRVQRRLTGKGGEVPFRSSGDYWQGRYAAGGNSGAGSYNHLAEFKAEVINGFVTTHGIADVVEFGCGDGNQLGYAVYPRYSGYDVSPQAVQICRQRFAGDRTREFFLLQDYDQRQADLTLSLDVIYHLVEDPVYEDYMRRLFLAARRYVIVYSSDREQAPAANSPHVRHRAFTKWVGQHCPDWTLMATIPNRFPYNGDASVTTFADFYIYERTGPVAGSPAAGR